MRVPSSSHHCPQTHIYSIKCAWGFVKVVTDLLYVLRKSKSCYAVNVFSRFFMRVFFPHLLFIVVVMISIIFALLFLPRMYLFVCWVICCWCNSRRFFSVIYPIFIKFFGKNFVQLCTFARTFTHTQIYTWHAHISYFVFFMGGNKIERKVCVKKNK